MQNIITFQQDDQLAITGVVWEMQILIKKKKINSHIQFRVSEKYFPTC